MLLSILLGIIKIIGWRFSAPSSSLSPLLLWEKSHKRCEISLSQIVSQSKSLLKLYLFTEIFYFLYCCRLFHCLFILTSSEFFPSKSITMLTFHPADVCPQFRLHLFFTVNYYPQISLIPFRLTFFCLLANIIKIHFSWQWKICNRFFTFSSSLSLFYRNCSRGASNL